MRVGVLGGGQLGRMLALAGYPLGARLRFLDPAPDAPAGHLAESIVAQYTDQSALEELASGSDVVTYEFENVPVESARFLAERAQLFPPPQALEVSQERLREKRFFQELGIPTPQFAPIDSEADLEPAIERVGLPAVLKTRRFGYDGKGQRIVHSLTEAAQAWEALGRVPLICEEYIKFERELSVLAVRARDGAIAVYPVVENHHRDGILRLSLAPAPKLTPELQAQATDYITRALTALDYVGLLTIELLQHRENLLANEMAPRVHNSGHWTIEGAQTSQFENHLRAILGLPLGATHARGFCAMMNLIGTTPDPRAVLKIPGAHLHLYGKAPRPGRKLGHITLCESDPKELDEKLSRVQALLA